MNVRDTELYVIVGRGYIHTHTREKPRKVEEQLVRVTKVSKEEIEKLWSGKKY